MLVVVTDLDGTLLDHHTYSWEPARPALERLASEGCPVIFATSKTRAEVAWWREQTGNRDPFIVENGGAVYIPRGYFPFAVPGAVPRDEFDAVEFGTPYPELVQVLRAAAEETAAEVRGFHQMSVEEVAARTSLPREQAALAKQREYLEPFEFLNGEPQGALLRAIERRGLRWTCGGRFYHVTGANDKGAAVRLLLRLYRRAHDAIRSAAAGDGWNDVPMLAAVDLPIVMQSPQAEAIRASLGRGRITGRPGPAGWNEAMLALLGHD